MTDQPHQSHTSGTRFLSRRGMLWLGSIVLLFPLYRFLGYKVPKKPRKIEINSTVPATGVLIHSEFILFDREGKCWALPRKCTHLGCKVQYHERENIVECPCHQSRFSINGQVLRGPAKENLAVFDVEKRETAPYYVITV